jgi:hypothetical protein
MTAKPSQSHYQQQRINNFPCCATYLTHRIPAIPPVTTESGTQIDRCGPFSTIKIPSSQSYHQSQRNPECKSADVGHSQQSRFHQVSHSTSHNGIRNANRPMWVNLDISDSVTLDTRISKRMNYDRNNFENIPLTATREPTSIDPTLIATAMTILTATMLIVPTLTAR